MEGCTGNSPPPPRYHQHPLVSKKSLVDPSSVLVWLRQTVLAGIKSFRFFLSFFIIRFFETTVFFCWLWNKVRIPQLFEICFTRMPYRVGSPTLSCQLRKEMAKITMALKKRNRKFNFTSRSVYYLEPSCCSVLPI